LLLAVVLYMIFLPLWWMALDWIAWFSGTCADFVYHAFNSQVSINPNGKIITVAVRIPEQASAEPFKLSLKMDTVTYGMPMFAALALATRADSLFAKARALAVGLLAMLLLSAPVVMMWAKIASLELEEKLAMTSDAGDRSSFFYYAFHGYAFSQPIAAIAIWLALLMLGAFKSKPKPEAPAAATARNAPCPCGSRRKYKRCCGRA
jgi:SEC-C motif-containing protein